MTKKIKFTLDQQIKYLSNSNNCPFCDSDDCEGGFIEVDFGNAFQKMTCNECNHSWDDQYRFEGINAGSIRNSDGEPVEAELPDLTPDTALEKFCGDTGFDADNRLDIALSFIGENCDMVQWQAFLNERAKEENGDAE